MIQKVIYSEGEERHLNVTFFYLDFFEYVLKKETTNASKCIRHPKTYIPECFHSTTFLHF